MPGSVGLLCMVLLLCFSAQAWAKCPDQDVLKDAQGALKQLAGIDAKSADADKLDDIKEKLQPAADLEVDDQDPVCSSRAKRVRGEARTGLAKILKLMQGVNTVTVNVLTSFLEEAKPDDLLVVKLDGEKISGTRATCGPGRHELSVLRAPSTEMHAVETKVLIDKVLRKPDSSTGNEEIYAFVAKEKQDIDLAIHVIGKTVFAPTQVTTKLTSELSGVSLQLNGKPAVGGGTYPLKLGPSKLAITHPRSNDERWVHVSATLDNVPIKPSVIDPAVKIYNFEAVEQRTLNMNLKVEQGPFEHPLRPILIWGGLGVTVVGTVISAWQLVLMDNRDDEVAKLTEENGCTISPLPDTCNEEVQNQILGKYDKRDSNETVAVISGVAGGLGFVAFWIGLLALESGTDDPNEEARFTGSRAYASADKSHDHALVRNLNLLPVAGAGVYGASLSGAF